MTLTIELGEAREIKEVAVSDRAHLKSSKTDNVLWLKASDKMQPQPVSIRAERKDGGKAEIYVIEWVADAVAGRSCDLVRFTYPRDVVEARRAEQERRRAAWEAGAASRALHAAASQPSGPQTTPSVINKAYSITGSRALLPAQLAPATTAAATPTPIPLHDGATR
jgi:type IV secretory pathway VirB9-like protein